VHVRAFLGQKCAKTGQSCFLCQVQIYMPCVRKSVTRTEEKHSHGATNRVFTSMITGTSYVYSKIHRDLQVARRNVTMRPIRVTTVDMAKQ